MELFCKIYATLIILSIFTSLFGVIMYGMSEMCDKKRILYIILIYSFPTLIAGLIIISMIYNIWFI